jgi:glycosyltransferase involved in cell wall biosynthesis
MNVLFVIHYPFFGGPQNQALRLARPLEERGVHTIVVLPDEPGNAAERLRAAGVDVRQIPLHRLRSTRDLRTHLQFAAGFWREVSALRRLIRAEQIDVVQVGGLVNPHGAIAARLEHRPVVWQLLDTRAPAPIAAASMIWVVELADVVMTTGAAVARAHPGYGAIADRVVPFFPPVDTERFAPHSDLRAAVRTAWGVPVDAPVVGCVANINPQKGVVELVRAFARARASTPDARLVLVGAEHPSHTAYSAAVRAQITDRGLVEGRDVIFFGARDDIERQLVGMDVFALAAVPRSEGITTAVLEAMAAGLPVVVTDVGALREAVEDGRTGFLVPPDDAAGFAVALSRLVADPVRRASMGEAARHVALQRFGLAACIDTHVRVYAEALAAHR